MFLCSYWGIHPLSLCCCAWLVFLGFSVLSRTLLRYSPWPFFGTHLDFTLFQYSPDPSPILTQILPHFDTRSNTISSPASCLDFLRFFGTLPDLIHFPSVYSGLVSESPDLFQHHVWFPLVFSSIMSRFLYLSPTLCLDPLVHSVSMTHFP